MSAPYDLVRVDDPDLGQFTTTRAYAQAQGLKILAKTATTDRGKPRPPVARTKKKTTGNPAPTNTKKEIGQK